MNQSTTYFVDLVNPISTLSEGACFKKSNDKSDKKPKDSKPWYNLDCKRYKTSFICGKTNDAVMMNKVTPHRYVNGAKF